MNKVVNVRSGVVFGMILSLILVGVLLAYFVTNGTQQPSISQLTISDNYGLVEDVPENNGKILGSGNNTYTGGNVVSNNVGGVYTLEAKPTTSVLGASYVFAYWQTSDGVKISGDETIKVLNYSVESPQYVPVFIQEYNSEHISTGLVHRISSLSYFTVNTSTGLFRRADLPEDTNEYQGMIILNNDIVIEQGATFTSIGYNSGGTPIEFQGVFDGNGHKISGLNVNTGGLFMKLNGGVLKNITISSGNIMGSGDCIGAFCNTMTNAVISRCTNYASVTCTNASGIGGGLVGKSLRATAAVSPSTLYCNNNYGTVIAKTPSGIIGASVDAVSGTALASCNMYKNNSTGGCSKYSI